MKCPDCSFEAKSRAALAGHRHRSHSQSTGTNVAAVEVTLAELKRLGRLEKIDSARVQALRSMAAALDLNPFNSQMWKEYRESIGDLTADGSNDGAVDDLINELSTPLRHSA